MILQNVVAQREAKTQFVINHLVDLSKQVLLNWPIAHVSSLCSSLLKNSIMRFRALLRLWWVHDLLNVYMVIQLHFILISMCETLLASL